LNAWTWHGRTSATRQPTEENGKNGLPDVLQAQEGLTS